MGEIKYEKNTYHCCFIVLLFAKSYRNHDVGVLNLRNYYGSYPIEDHQSINPENNHLSHQLVFLWIIRQ